VWWVQNQRQLLDLELQQAYRSQFEHLYGYLCSFHDDLSFPRSFWLQANASILYALSLPYVSAWQQYQHPRMKSELCQVPHNPQYQLRIITHLHATWSFCLQDEICKLVVPVHHYHDAHRPIVCLNTFYKRIYYFAHKRTARSRNQIYSCSLHYDNALCFLPNWLISLCLVQLLNPWVYEFCRYTCWRWLLWPKSILKLQGFQMQLPDGLQYYHIGQFLMATCQFWAGSKQPYDDLCNWPNATVYIYHFFLHLPAFWMDLLRHLRSNQTIPCCRRL